MKDVKLTIYPFKSDLTGNTRYMICVRENGSLILKYPMPHEVDTINKLFMTIPTFIAENDYNVVDFDMSINSGDV